MNLICRTVVFTLVLTLSLVGIPVPTHAVGDKSPPLTFNGRPLSELLRGRATGVPFPLPALRQQVSGQISGVALDAEGQPLAEQTVRLTRPFTVNNGRSARQIVGMDTTDTAGGFSFAGLQASDYVVEVLRGDEVAASASMTLAAGAMQVSGLTVLVEPASEMNRGLAIAVAAGLVLGTLAIIGIQAYGDSTPVPLTR